MADQTVPPKNERGEWLTRDGHVLTASNPFISEAKWVVFVYPNHTDMRHPWEPACGWREGSSWSACDLRVDHSSSHAVGTHIGQRSTYAYEIPEMETTP